MKILPNINFWYKMNIYIEREILPGRWSIQWYNNYNILLVINKYKQFFTRAIKNTSVRHETMTVYLSNNLSFWKTFYLFSTEWYIIVKKATFDKCLSKITLLSIFGKFAWKKMRLSSLLIACHDFWNRLFL